ncbi:MAG: AEC family transporter [Burkholderiaceae bacterium]
MIDAVAPIILLIGLGVLVAWRELLPADGIGHVSNLTFRVFIPALLFYSMARADLALLQWDVPLAYFGATVALFLAAQAGLRLRGLDRKEAIARSMGMTFPNTVMLGIPVITLAYGQPGLASLLPILALNSLIMLGGPSIMIESGERSNRHGRLWGVVTTVQRALLHPFVVAIMVGLAWSSTGWSLPGAIDQSLSMMSAAATPMCLVVLGASLAQQFELPMLRHSMLESLVKLLVHPLLVWLVGRYLVGLEPVPLAVVTVLGATSTGANVVLFAHRYQVAIGRVSAVAATTTALGVASLPIILWLFGPL